MARGMSERPERLDPATGTSRMGQTQSERPAGAYQRPGNAGVSAPTPRLGAGGMMRGYGQPGGPMARQGGGPSVQATASAPALGRGSLQQGMTGPALRSGNQMSDFEPSPMASADESRADVIGGILETVRRNGGNPADLR